MLKICNLPTLYVYRMLTFTRENFFWYKWCISYAPVSLIKALPLPWKCQFDIGYWHRTLNIDVNTSKIHFGLIKYMEKETLVDQEQTLTVQPLI